jgi:hypothetical protein
MEVDFMDIRCAFRPVIGAVLGLMAAGCGSSSNPTTEIGREAGLWKGQVRIQNIYHTGKDTDVQRFVEESTSTSCQPKRPPQAIPTIGGEAIVRRVIDVPEDGMTIIVEVPRKGGAFSGPLSVIVRRQSSAAVMTEDVLRAQPSLLRPELGVDVNAGSWVFTRLGDCPPGMKPYEKLPASQ